MEFANKSSPALCPFLCPLIGIFLQEQSEEKKKKTTTVMITNELMVIDWLVSCREGCSVSGWMGTSSALPLSPGFCKDSLLQPVILRQVGWTESFGLIALWCRWWIKPCFLLEHRGLCNLQGALPSINSEKPRGNVSCYTEEEVQVKQWIGLTICWIPF